MPSARAGSRYCCTCEFWAGFRSLSDFGERVGYEHRTSVGECTLGNLDWAGQQRTALSNCTHWQQWSVPEHTGMALRPAV